MLSPKWQSERKGLFNRNAASQSIKLIYKVITSFKLIFCLPDHRRCGLLSHEAGSELQRVG